MDYSGMKVSIMGLGLHGGGLESAKYLIKKGAIVSVTDLRDEKILAPSIEQLDSVSSSVRYVLGRHEMQDFENADMVIKNPGVPLSSPYLQAARRIETDLSLFFLESQARLTAVTGTKGKSTASTAIYWVLQNYYRQKTLAAGSVGDSASMDTSGSVSGQAQVYLGGNITVSPLTFLDKLKPNDDVVLELSSFQLGDLANRKKADASPLFKPKAAVITAIMSDHQDRYPNMEAYVADKRIIYQSQDKSDFTIAADDSWGRSFHEESKARPLVYSDTPLDIDVSGAWAGGKGKPCFACMRDSPLQGLDVNRIVQLVPAKPLLPGAHQKKNLMSAGLALLGLGLDPETICANLGAFAGVEHRLEFFFEAGGVRFYNDSAATIPEAAAAAVEAFDASRMILVTGGTDKNLDFSPLVKAASAVKALVLLNGTGTDKLIKEFEKSGIAYQGPFDSVEKAAKTAAGLACNGDSVVLSPGCASFEMFNNEFDRGNKWKSAVVSVSR